MLNNIYSPIQPPASFSLPHLPCCFEVEKLLISLPPFQLCMSMEPTLRWVSTQGAAKLKASSSSREGSNDGI